LQETGSVASPPPYDLGHRLPYLINRVGSALATGFAQEALTRHRLSIVMWRVLAVLANQGEQRQIDLSELTSIDASTLSRLVSRLARLHLVTRTRSKTDSREVLVQLTAKGRDIADRLIPVIVSYEEAAVAGLSKRDLEVVRRCLQHMYANIVGKALLGRAGAGRRKRRAAAR
jgi:DNA-binding MarR family transcriptional regulator